MNPTLRVAAQQQQSCAADYQGGGAAAAAAECTQINRAQAALLCAVAAENPSSSLSSPFTNQTNNAEKIIENK